MKFRSISSMPTIQLRITHSIPKLQRWREELTGCKPSDKPTTGGSTYAYRAEGEETAFIVYMHDNLEYPAASDAALLAHEAVHVAQGYFESIGEDNPASEEFAYVVQSVAEYLITEHFDWKRKRLERF